MTLPHLRLKAWARVLAILTAIVCTLAVLPALLPAAFAINMLDEPGHGLLHDIYVRFTRGVLLFMPAIALIGVFAPWRIYRRGQYSKTVTLCVVVLALVGYWSYWAYGIYFT